MVIEESRADHVRMIMAAASHTCVVGDIEPHILRSWSRCVRDYGLDPEQQGEVSIVDAASLRERREGLREVLDIAGPELQRLHQQIAGLGFAVVLTDCEGVILSRVAKSSAEAVFSDAGLTYGARWCEELTGTNGMGTCLAERAPVTVHRGEHFRTRYTGLTCSAAPINNPDGSLVAVLDASALSSADSRGGQLHTMALVKMSATVIENFLFLQRFRGAWVLRFHSRPELVGLLAEGMLAVDSEGRVLAANPSAAAHLRCRSWDELVARPLQTVFDLTPECLRDRAQHGGSSTIWPIRDAVSANHYYATVRSPEDLSPRRLLCLRRRPLRPFRRPPGDPGLSLRAIVGRDPQMIRNAEAAMRVLNRDIPILLRGQSGVGKESFARALHRAGERAKGPFVAVNCDSLRDGYGERELFGCRPAAGAEGYAGNRGRIAQAHTGTLYLEEIGELPLPLQTRVLRVLEDREVLPVGGERALAVDLQLIASSRMDLEALVQQGALREELYYRLDGLTLTLPPLRERADIKELIDSLLDLENFTDQPLVVEPAAMGLLLSHDWPGNLRQLRSVVRRAVALCSEGRIRVGDLPPAFGGPERPEPLASGPRPLGIACPVGASARLEEAERGALLRELELRRWNVTTTAVALGISRNTLYRRMKRLGIPPSQRLLAEVH